MKKLVVLFAFAAVSTFAAQVTGFVADSKCGAKHADASEAAPRAPSNALRAEPPL